MELIEPGPRWPLMDGCGTRALEKHWQQRLPPHTLMQRAGLACARLALALAPHARRIWIACGPGNNGGDGLQAAIHLAQWGKPVWVTWLGSPERAPADTRATWAAFVQAGLQIQPQPPDDFDLGIDALLGIGAQRPPQGEMADWITHINTRRVPNQACVLAVDLPSGLIAGSGRAHALHVQATHTLSLLTLKTGLFTGQGRDACGQIWFDGLDVSTDNSNGDNTAEPTAWLNPSPRDVPRAHASHKGSYGDVAVIGGAPGMSGALWLAASGALHHGAGKVFAGSLDEPPASSLPGLPEVMCRPVQDLVLDHARTATVCGCGGGQAVERWLDAVLTRAAQLVLDADALNALALDHAPAHAWATLLRQRQSRGQATVLTPHPLEAARLLGRDTPTVQANRIDSARELAERFQCTVVLKGSGTVIAAPGQTPRINPTGSARLAAGGTGDVLAGMIGAELAAGHDAFDAACRATYTHGLRGQQMPSSFEGAALTASQLAGG
ncbi:MAG: Bifunctional NAD(P)H-hydrate repair enzyme Nnr [Paracidovorax wautersii]|uniref:Bifunctional NAD(P)H-hydrate repair enzyme n=1 Tax=Paracidovorax wautersii TaxID=1177982 RepID=A0A7V8FS62_9BURK|nr:MAG: Bifunctional NAD(P)H-hydrate repair enzyme Nnr [Paracidovorax wautersii]